MAKLIRDKYIEIIPKERLTTVKDGKLLETFLNNKITEELTELRQSGFEDINEWADVFETLYAMAKLHGILPLDIDVAQRKKRELRGGFDDGIVLMEDPNQYALFEENGSVVNT